ncbi:MAG: hypothetical protein LBR60_01780, partial [Fibrobacter sp.]|nr:hypothetical protein [Fibrobacter sp.]
ADPGADGISSYTVDDYYIPLSPRLSVSLQTQYASEEQVAEADKNNKLEPSLMVLPRVIYLPRNPKGKLTDYYSVLKLNGALSNAGTSVCAPGATYGGTLPATTNPLIGSDTTTYLRSDIYNCVFTPAASTQPLDNIPFFVWVGGSTDEVPEVSFEQNQFIDGFIDGDNQCQFVNIKFAVGSEPANVGISVTGDASWIISTLSATGSGPYTATVSGALTPVLKVCRALTPSSDASSIRFDLTAPCDGCRLETSPVPLSWSITGNFNIVRKSLEEKADTTAEQMEFFRFPPCDATYLNGNEWIQAVASAGGNCISKTKNEAWNCTDAEFGTTFMRQASLLSPGLAVACSVMVVPGLVNEGGDTSYTAYGDIRLHPYTLTVASNKTKSVDVDGDAPHDIDTTFNTDGYTRVFYKLPYTVEVSYNESSERLRSATCFVPVMADTSCTHNGGGKFTVTPEGDTELYLKFVNLGDCFNGLTGFTGWGYDCSGNHCAGITNSVAALEVGNTEGMSPGWAQIGADSLTVTAPVITPAGDLVNSVIALKTFRGMTDGYLEATVNMNGLSVSPAVIFRSNVAASDYYSLFVQSVAGINTLQLCDSDFSGINCKALFTLNTLNNTAPFTLTVDFEGQALFASFSQAGAYQSYADSSLVKTGNNRFGFAFPEASASGMNKGELHGFLALSLSADGSCKVDGTTLPVPTLGCKTGLTFRTGESVAAGDLVTVNGNGAVCGAPIFTVTPDFVSPLTPGDVGSHSASISVDCRYLTTIDAPPSPSEVTCSFEVLDAAACEFKQEWCPGIDWATGIKWGENLNNIGTLVPNQHDAACLFLSSSDIGWNGLFTATPGDGGYYMYVVHDNQYNTPGANSNLPRTKPDCVGPELAPTATCSWNHTLNPGDPVPQPDVQCSDGTMPTITQIEVEPPFSVGGGGTWLNPGVPGGSGTWLDPSTDDLEDGETYTAKVEVSKCGSKTPENGGIGKWINCTGSVTVGGPASSSSSGGGTVVTIGANGNSENTLNAGQTYEIHCSPENGGQIQCKTEDKTSSSFTWDGTDQTSNPDYWSCQAPCTNNEVHTLIVGPKNIVCRKGC